MTRLMTALALISFSGVTLSAAPTTWTGRISDSLCGATHASAPEHGAKEMTDRECTESCIKKGAKYVFVSKGNVYEISNQTFAGLATHAAHTVRLTGEMTGKSIAVSEIRMPVMRPLARTPSRIR